MAFSKKCGLLFFKQQQTTVGFVQWGCNWMFLSSFSSWRIFPAAGFEASLWVGPTCPFRLLASGDLGPATLQSPSCSESFAHALLTHPHMAQPHYLFFIRHDPDPNVSFSGRFADQPGWPHSFSFECLQNFVSSTHKVFLCGMLHCTCPQQMCVEQLLYARCSLCSGDTNKVLFQWSLYSSVWNRMNKYRYMQ